MGEECGEDPCGICVWPSLRTWLEGCVSPGLTDQESLTPQSISPDTYNHWQHSGKQCLLILSVHQENGPLCGPLLSLFSRYIGGLRCLERDHTPACKMQDATGWPVSLPSVFPLITCVVVSMAKRQPLNLPLYSVMWPFPSFKALIWGLWTHLQVAARVRRQGQALLKQTCGSRASHLPQALPLNS